MPIYEYKGFDTVKGGTKTGIIDADSPREARARLREQAVMVTDLEMSDVSAHSADEHSGAAKKPRRRLRRIFSVERKLKGEGALPIYTRQLATLLKSGIPLAQGLGALVDQVEHKGIEAILRDVREQVMRGKTFGDALAMHPRLFDELFVNMVRAGEASGNLDAVLMRLADYRVRQQRIASRIKTALIYPIIMLFVGACVVIFLVNVVVPKLITVAKSRNQSLPWMTEMLDGFSRFMQNNLLLLVSVLFGAWILWKYVFLARAEVRLWWDGMKLRLPVVGDLFKKQIVSRFAVTMSTLLRSGVTVLDSLEIVKTVLANKLMQKVLEEVRTRILEGADIATPLKKLRRVPAGRRLHGRGRRTDRPARGDAGPHRGSVRRRDRDQHRPARWPMLEPAMIVAHGICRRLYRGLRHDAHLAVHPPRLERGLRSQLWTQTTKTETVKRVHADRDHGRGHHHWPARDARRPADLAPCSDSVRRATARTTMCQQLLQRREVLAHGDQAHQATIEEMEAPLKPGEGNYQKAEEDPWGNMYYLERDGNKVKIWSWGPDGQEGTEDDISYPESEDR